MGMLCALIAPFGARKTRGSLETMIFLSGLGSSYATTEDTRKLNEEEIEEFQIG
jgi:hypothetical protein